MSETQEKKQVVGLSAEDIQAMVTAAVVAAITESKKPTVLEQAELDRKAAEKEQAMTARVSLGKSVLAELKQKKLNQSVCSHEAADGHTHAVYVQEKSGPGYFICQKLQCKIRPEPKPADKTVDNGAIYDTREFNRLMQKQRTADVIG